MHDLSGAELRQKQAIIDFLSKNTSTVTSRSALNAFKKILEDSDCTYMLEEPPDAPPINAPQFGLDDDKKRLAFECWNKLHEIGERKFSGHGGVPIDTKAMASKWLNIIQEKTLDDLYSWIKVLLWYHKNKETKCKKDGTHGRQDGEKMMPHSD